jgi:hypothetical protein
LRQAKPHRHAGEQSLGAGENTLHLDLQVPMVITYYARLNNETLKRFHFFAPSAVFARIKHGCPSRRFCAPNQVTLEPTIRTMFVEQHF